MVNIGHAVFIVVSYSIIDLVIGWLIYIIASKKFNLDEKKNVYYVLTGFYMVRAMTLCYLFLKDLDKTFAAYLFLVNIPFGLYNLFSPKANKKSLKREVEATYFVNCIGLLMIAAMMIFNV